MIARATARAIMYGTTAGPPATSTVLGQTF
jgi:hypothetical protein